MITIDDLQKVDLRVGKILTAERVENSEKLLKLQVDLGGEQRQILSGIAKYYSPDELVGKSVVVVVNLGSRQMMGMESNGMMLAAADETGMVVLLGTDKEIAPGSSIR